ncbi:MAG: glycerophosphodiester phosphodiesterase family protein [Candidatus Izemoplasmatales bacterium]|jgi:glycerophosphoryl diester phosphodiesterase|nr:glycerophosphodiester phosphodiesterase family protein [Candidatus Izemoplasmatales bacterium]MDD3865307.1 glycerophosphodiester phosphodiesterase family protein [Candidatus Izemoplasmatales bacterium]
MNTVKIDKYFKGMIAHRGLSGIETENTINAFLAAANRSYFGIECDVYASKDGKIIITHDDTLLRLGMLNLYIPSFRYEEIKKFGLIDRKSGNLSDNICIPLLSEYLQICKSYKKHGFVELKDNLSFDNLDDIVAQIGQFGQNDHISLIAFSEKYLTYVRKNFPDIDLYLLAEKINDKIIDYCERHRINLDVRYDVLDETSIKRLHLSGLKVGVWTVDDKETAEKLIKLGVDYVTSNILE